MLFSVFIADNCTGLAVTSDLDSNPASATYVCLWASLSFRGFWMSFFFQVLLYQKFIRFPVLEVSILKNVLDYLSIIICIEIYMHVCINALV